MGCRKELQMLTILLLITYLALGESADDGINKLGTILKQMKASTENPLLYENSSIATACEGRTPNSEICSSLCETNVDKFADYQLDIIYCIGYLFFESTFNVPLGTLSIPLRDDSYLGKCTLRTNDASVFTLQTTSPFAHEVTTPDPNSPTYIFRAEVAFYWEHLIIECAPFPCSAAQFQKPSKEVLKATSCKMPLLFNPHFLDRTLDLGDCLNYKPGQGAKENCSFPINVTQVLVDNYTYAFNSPDEFSYKQIDSYVNYTFDEPLRSAPVYYQGVIENGIQSFLDDEVVVSNLHQIEQNMVKKMSSSFRKYYCNGQCSNLNCDSNL